MGCDIHAHLEIKVNNEWLYYSPVPIDRNYKLFARMGDCGRCQDIRPIATTRGTPKDVSKTLQLHIDDWELDGHGWSWLKFGELWHIAIEFKNEWHDGWCVGFLGDNHVWLFENAVEGWQKYKEDYPSFIQDIRLIFWFDN